MRHTVPHSIKKDTLNTSYYIYTIFLETHGRKRTNRYTSIKDSGRTRTGYGQLSCIFRRKPDQGGASALKKHPTEGAEIFLIQFGQGQQEQEHFACFTQLEEKFYGKESQIMVSIDQNLSIGLGIQFRQHYSHITNQDPWISGNYFLIFVKVHS